MRILPVGLAAVEPFHPQPHAQLVVVDQDQVAGWIAVRVVVARHHVACAFLRPQREPGVEIPVVEQPCLPVEEVLYLGAGHRTQMEAGCAAAAIRVARGQGLGFRDEAADPFPGPVAEGFVTDCEL